jgi:hypothetical protein
VPEAATVPYRVSSRHSRLTMSVNMRPKSIDPCRRSTRICQWENEAMSLLIMSRDKARLYHVIQQKLL